MISKTRTAWVDKIAGLFESNYRFWSTREQLTSTGRKRNCQRKTSGMSSKRTHQDIYCKEHYSKGNEKFCIIYITNRKIAYCFLIGSSVFTNFTFALHLTFLLLQCFRQRYPSNTEPSNSQFRAVNHLVLHTGFT